MKRGFIWTAFAAHRWDLWDRVQLEDRPTWSSRWGLLLALSMSVFWTSGSGEASGSQLVAIISDRWESWGGSPWVWALATPSRRQL